MSSGDAVWFHGTDETFHEWVFPPPEKPGNEGIVVAHSAVYLTTHEEFARAAGGKLCSAQLQPFAKTLDTAQDSRALESLRLAVRQNKLASLCAWTSSADVWEKAWRNGDVLRVAYGTVEAQYFIEREVASQAKQLQESYKLPLETAKTIAYQNLTRGWIELISVVARSLGWDAIVGNEVDRHSTSSVIARPLLIALTVNALSPPKWV
jgi:hypothetical protein